MQHRPFTKVRFSTGSFGVSVIPGDCRTSPTRAGGPSNLLPQGLGPGLGGAHLFQVHFGGLSLGTGVQPCQLRTRSAFSNFSCCWGRCAREGPKSGHHLKALGNLVLEIATTAAEGQCCCIPEGEHFRGAQRRMRGRPLPPGTR